MPRRKAKHLHTREAVALVALTLALTGSGPVAARADVTCGADLSLTAIPTAVKSVDGLAAVSSTDVWGLGSSIGNPSAAAAIHWDGTGWTSVPLPPLSGEASFNAGAAISPDDVWGVGTVLSRGRYGALAEHWDGTSWQLSTLPPVPGQNVALVDVAAASSSDVWAVGFAAAGSKRVPVTLHWDGNAWTSIGAANGGSKSNALLGVAIRGTGDIWAVGYSSKGLGFRTLVEHWNGAGWSVVSARNPGPVEDVFTDAAVAPNGTIWAVGYQVAGIVTSPLVERWNGVAWKAIPAPNTGSPVGVLRDIAFSQDGTAWAVGIFQDPASGIDLPLALHFDGSVWSITPSPTTAGLDTSFSSVAVVGGTGEVWAGGRATFVAHACGGSPTTTPASAPYSASVGAAGQGRLVTAGADLTAQLPQSAPLTVTAQDVASSAGIAETTKTFGAAVGNVNADGTPDIVLGRHQVPAHLYLNQGDSTFAEPNPALFPARDRHRCVMLDVQSDGLEDIMCATGADGGTEIKRSELWIQQGDGTFLDEAAAYGVLDPLGRGRTPVVLDANHDGRPDLFLADRHVRPDGLPSPDRLMLNEGGTGFVDSPSFGLDLDAGIESSCAHAGDVNGDGFDDLVLCGPSSLAIERNDAGTGFTNITKAMQAKGKSTDSLLVDMNGDTVPDLVNATDSSVEVRFQSGGVFEAPVFSYPATGVLGLAAGDVNGDGQRDLYVLRGSDASSLNAPDTLLLNGGSGASFDELAIPETSSGSADTVVALDFDANGLTDFLVLNGSTPSLPGPVQLIASFPAP